MSMPFDEGIPVDTESLSEEAVGSDQLLDDSESEVTESADESSEESAPVISAAEAERREQQSWKDRFFATQAKLEALTDKLNEVSLKQLSPQPPMAQEDVSPEEDPEELVRANWGDDPALLMMAKTLKATQQKLNQYEASQSQTTAKTVYETIESFALAHKADLDKTEIGNRFMEEISDRLPIPFDQLVEQARSGKRFDPALVASLQGKLEKAYAVASGKNPYSKVKSPKVAKADARIQSRSESPSGVVPVADKKQAGKEPSNYREALAAARGRKIPT